MKPVLRKIQPLTNISTNHICSVKARSKHSRAFFLRLKKNMRFSIVTSENVLPHCEA
jgi:hypothetical protein